MRELLLLRGLPGSGKSSLAEILSEKGKHPQYSIDDYFINSRGEYVFEFDKNHLAYKECQKKVEESMNSEAPFIIVHNVFSMEWEWEPYFKLASKYSYRVHVVCVENHHGGKNVHDVSQEQLEKMAAKFKVKLY